jgi:hypothetical protein
MKKALVVLLILAVAGGVFAQEVTFSGSLDTGLTIGIPSASGADPFVTLYNDDAGPARLRLNGTFSLANYGAKFRFQNAFADGNNTAIAAWAWVYANFLNDILTLNVGRLGNHAWATMGNYDTGWDNVTGLRLEIKPITGLNFGFALKALPYETSYTVSQFFLETLIGVKYESDLFDANLVFQLDSDADDIVGGTAAKGDPLEYLLDPTNPEKAYTPAVPGKGSADNIGVLYGVSIKAVPQLTAIIDGAVTWLGDFSNSGVIAVREKFAYAISDPLSVGINLAQNLYGNSDVKPYLKFEPFVSYKISEPVTLSLNIGLADELLNDDGDVVSGTEFKSLTITVKPKVSYALGEKAKIEGWYLGTFKTDDGVPYGKPEVPHKVQVNFGWSF